MRHRPRQRSIDGSTALEIATQRVTGVITPRNPWLFRLRAGLRDQEDPTGHRMSPLTKSATAYIYIVSAFPSNFPRLVHSIGQVPLSPTATPPFIFRTSYSAMLAKSLALFFVFTSFVSAATIPCELKLVSRLIHSQAQSLYFSPSPYIGFTT